MTWPNKIKTLLKKVLFAECSNPFKMIKVGNFTLVANRESRLDEFQSRHPNYSFNFSRLVAQVLGSDTHSLIIDVGANIGDTVALIRSAQVNNPIVCIEGNPTYLTLLHQNVELFDHITVIETFLGDRTAEMKANIVTAEGTAKLVDDTNGVKVNLTTLDDLMISKKLNHIRILKTDTDGFDILVLKGAKQLIARHLPVLFFEYDNQLNVAKESCLDYLLSLRETGYDQTLFYDNLGNFLMALSLADRHLIAQLDSYINNNGAFQYFDVAVFHKRDQALASAIIASFGK